MKEKKEKKEKEKKEKTAKQSSEKNSVRKYNTPLCDDSMSFEECEIAVLRHAVDESGIKYAAKVYTNQDIKDILAIVEDFIRHKRMLLYGGTAINNILPKSAQFYDYDEELPDYDFYSKNAFEDALELADIYFKKGYKDVEAKSGVHFGTYKVFVNFIPIADITFLDPTIFNAVMKDAIVIDRMHYCSADFLRMSMFLELSRPAGDVSRWEKVFKRLTLLNTHYPMNPGTDCMSVEFQRKMDSNTELSEKIYLTVRDAFIHQGVVFFGGYAVNLYSKYMPANEQKLIKKIPDFDVLSEEPIKVAEFTRDRLKDAGFSDVRVVKHPAVGEIIPEHYDIRVGDETVAFVYTPIGCHSFNTIEVGNNEINVATIDTILSFYLAFIYANRPYFQKNRLLCMAKFLFDVEHRNRLEQKGLLTRFSINCYGKQPSLDDIRSEKAEKFKELSQNRNSLEYHKWFLKYNPSNPNQVLNKLRKTRKIRPMIPENREPGEKIHKNGVQKQGRFSTRRRYRSKKSSNYFF